MPTDPLSLPARDDTLLGICEGLGEEFGVNPIWLRVALGGAVLWNPLATIAGYLVLGLVLVLARRLVPAAAASPVDTPVIVANDPIAPELSLAA